MWDHSLGREAAFVVGGVQGAGGKGVGAEGSWYSFSIEPIARLIVTVAAGREGA